ncbi:unnamed protein product, partial [Onchocerca ochengi]
FHNWSVFVFLQFERIKNDGEIRYNLRKAIMQTIRWFSEKNNPLYNDKRLFDVFCIAVTAVSSNAPLASPTPVPQSSLSLGKGNDSSIADQLKNIQLREVSAPALSNSAAVGFSNLLSELEATPSKRKNLCDNSDSRSIGIDAAFPTNAVGSGILRRSRKKQVSNAGNAEQVLIVIERIILLRKPPYGLHDGFS